MGRHYLALAAKVFLPVLFQEVLLLRAPADTLLILPLPAASLFCNASNVPPAIYIAPFIKSGLVRARFIGCFMGFICFAPAKRRCMASSSTFKDFLGGFMGIIAYLTPEWDRVRPRRDLHVSSRCLHPGMSYLKQSQTAFYE
jgi:hypothetical protein